MFESFRLTHPQSTAILSLVLLGILLMMVLPIPAWLLDIGLAASFALSILIFTTTLFVDRPINFSSFPSILLATLLLRLALNVSSTKLIIANGHTGPQAAGSVIHGFSMFIMDENILLGIVIFSVLIIVNFMVITKGAGRMAEVGARFALDGMPGKQLSIDSDLSAGAITHEEARARRDLEQAETTFFGSLDGASKFVKGDAIAGLLIIILNFFVGIITGVTLHDMVIIDAVNTYSILTVGDGLVTQIPAVIISTSAGILISRSGSTEPMDQAVLSQLGRSPYSLYTVSFLLLVLALLPGLPFLPFLIGAAALAVLAYISTLQEKSNEAEVVHDDLKAPAERSMGEILELDDLHIEFSPNLVEMVLDIGTGLDVRISNLRKHLAEKYGLIVPEVRLTDNAALPPDTYSINVLGVQQATDRVFPELLLAIVGETNNSLPDGQSVLEPVYGAPAVWISKDRREEAEVAGATVVAPTEVLATHLLEVVKSNFGRLLTHRSLKRLLSELSNLPDPDRAKSNSALIDELIPNKIPFEQLLIVLRLLLEEHVSIRNIPLILEAMAESHNAHQSAEVTCEYVRQRLGFQLVAEHRRDDGSLPIIQLAPEWESRFTQYELEPVGGLLDVALPPDLFETLSNSIAEKVKAIMEIGQSPVLASTGKRRRFLRTVVAARGISVPVLAFEEMGLDTRPAVVGIVGG